MTASLHQLGDGVHERSAGEVGSGSQFQAVKVETVCHKRQVISNQSARSIYGGVYEVQEDFRFAQERMPAE